MLVTFLRFVNIPALIPRRHVYPNCTRSNLNSARCGVDLVVQTALSFYGFTIANYYLFVIRSIASLSLYLSVVLWLINSAHYQMKEPFIRMKVR